MRCNLHLVTGHETVLAHVGLEVSDLATAHSFALRAIHEIQAEADQANEDWQGWRLDVVDPSGGILVSLPLGTMRH